MIEGAYMSEVFRAGIQSIHHQQIEASRSLGLTSWQTMRYVVLPQGLRIVSATGAVYGVPMSNARVQVTGCAIAQQQHLEQPQGADNRAERATDRRHGALARHVGTHAHVAHVAHVSAAEAVAVIRAYRRMPGTRVTAETCPHYLFFTEDDVARLGPYAKINPPIRTACGGSRPLSSS